MLRYVRCPVVSWTMTTATTAVSSTALVARTTGAAALSSPLLLLPPLRPVGRMPSAVRALSSSGGALAASLSSPSPTELGEIVKGERALLHATRVAIEKVDKLVGGGTAVEEDIETVKAASEQLDDKLNVVIVGEFNSGKSSLINALLGFKLAVEGVVPTTHQVNIIKYGPQRAAEQVVADNVTNLTAPVEWLQDINIVDTPGLNAVIRQHQKVTTHFLPRAELILFLTSADRPWTNSERDFVSTLLQWGKKVVLVLNKIDLAGGGRSVVENFVKDEALKLFSVAPAFFSVSARQAFKAKENKDDAALKSSGFEALENYIFTKLDVQERMLLKLTTPITIATTMAAKYARVIDKELAAVSRTEDSLKSLSAVVDESIAELQRDAPGHMNLAENVLLQLKDRSEVFLTKTMSYENILSVFRVESNRTAFEKDVIGSFTRHLEESTLGFGDWLEERAEELWKSVSSHMQSELASAVTTTSQPSAVASPFANVHKIVHKRLKPVLDSAAGLRLGGEVATTARNGVLMAMQAQAACLFVGGAGSLFVMADTLPSIAALVATVGLSGSLGGLVPFRRSLLRRSVDRRVDNLRAELRDAMKLALDDVVALCEEEIKHKITDGLLRNVDVRIKDVRATASALTSLKAEAGALNSKVMKTVGLPR